MAETCEYCGQKLGRNRCGTWHLDPDDTEFCRLIRESVEEGAR